MKRTSTCRNQLRRGGAHRSRERSFQKSVWGSQKSENAMAQACSMQRQNTDAECETQAPYVQHVHSRLVCFLGESLSQTHPKATNGRGTIDNILGRTVRTGETVEAYTKTSSQLCVIPSPRVAAPLSQVERGRGRLCCAPRREGGATRRTTHSCPSLKRACERG